MSTVLVICERCRRGEHSHDRYTQGGGDAGCPFTVQPPDGGPRVGCGCPVVVHIANVETRPHCPTCSCR